MDSTKITRIGVGILAALSTSLMATGALPAAHAAQRTGIQAVGTSKIIPLPLAGCPGLLGYWQSYAARGGSVLFNLATTVSNPSVSSYVSYATGGLRSTTDPNTIAGSVDGQYFSDRTWSPPPPASPDPSGPLFTARYPFNPDATDRLGVSINTQNPSVTFTLLSWGGGQVTVPDASCAHGVLYGFTATNPATMVTMTFKAGGFPVILH